MIDQLLADAQINPQQLDALALSRGPGSFTGVRIAAGVVQGIAYGADLPVVPVSTLAAMAQDCFNRHPLVQMAYTALDARMDEIFWGVYSRNSLGMAELTGLEAVTPVTALIFPDAPGYGVGSGWLAHRSALTDNLGQRILAVEAEVYPRAAAVAQLGAYGYAQGQAVNVEQAMPVYLRDKVASTQAERSLAAKPQ